MFLSERATLTLAPARDADGSRVVVVSWHQGESEWTEQMSLTAFDVTLLRDFCSAWLRIEDDPEPPEAA